MSQSPQSPDEKSGVEQLPATDDDTSTSDVPRSDEEGIGVQEADVEEAKPDAKE